MTFPPGVIFLQSLCLRFVSRRLCCFRFLCCLFKSFKDGILDLPVQFRCYGKADVLIFAAFQLAAGHEHRQPFFTVCHTHSGNQKATIKADSGNSFQPSLICELRRDFCCNLHIVSSKKIGPPHTGRPRRSLTLVVKKVFDTLGQGGEDRVLKEHIQTCQQQSSHHHRNQDLDSFSEPWMYTIEKVSG